MLNLKIIDVRTCTLTAPEIQKSLDEIGNGRYWQIQFRCDSQPRAEAVRQDIFEQAMKDGGQFEITILGTGAAVGIKMFKAPAFFWDASTGRDVPVKEWNETHPDNKVTDCK